MSDRILTIRQPYATLIMDGLKTVENRQWKTSYRGRVWVQASARPERHPCLPEGVTAPQDAPCGVILGHVTLTDIVEDADSEWAIDGQYHWLLANPVRCRPVAWQGGLGLRRFPGLRVAKQTAYAAC